MPVNDEVWWYATRAAGLMTWATAFGSVLIGLLLSLKSVKSRTGPWFFDLHRFLSSVSVIFLLTHLGTLVVHDADVFTWRALLIPGESTWETTAASMGVIAFWTLIVVELTSILRKHLSPTVWRMTHMLSIITMAAGTYHAWLSGSDVRNPITWSVAGIGSLLAVGLIAMRLQRKDDVPVGHLRKSDHEELLAEMRNRLESLPVPEKVGQPELQRDSAIALPRRAPLGAAAGSEDPLLADDGVTGTDSPFGSDPFGAPAPDPTVEIGGWVDDSPGDPVAPSGLDPFRHNERPADSEELGLLPSRPSPDPFQRARDLAATESAPSTNPFGSPEPTPDADPWRGQPFGDSPFGTTPFQENPFQDSNPLQESDPFAGSQPFEPSSPFGEPAPEEPAPFEDNPFAEPPPVLPNNLGPSPFGSEAPPAAPASSAPSAPASSPVDGSLPPLERGSNPFASPEPTVTAFSAPVDPAPAPPTAPTMAAAAAPAPPPLPTNSGEVDEAAYTAWLVEWLAFAEKYGDEMPEDPNRV